MDKTQMSVSLDELATICSCEPGSVRRAISRVNDRFQSVYLLVDQHIEGGASEVRYIIENAVVEFDEVLVPRAEA